MPYSKLTEHINRSFEPSSFTYSVETPGGYKFIHDDFTLQITLHVSCVNTCKDGMVLTLPRLQVPHTQTGSDLIKCLLDFCRQYEIYPVARDVDSRTVAFWRGPAHFEPWGTHPEDCIPDPSYLQILSSPA
jgi:hypothetical protein